MTNLELFTAAVFEALFFTETGPDTEYKQGQRIYDHSVANLKADCRSFWHRFGCYIEAETDGPGIVQAGHDFWYSRNGHGVGFFDGDWPIYGDMLQEAAENYGEFYPDFVQ